VLYKQPSDPSAFDRYYFETHVPKARGLPGLRSYVVSSSKPDPVAGDEAPYLVAELEFDSKADFQAAMASGAGEATVADLANFAQAGVTVLAFDTRAV
jgi:uncharacterized protein (TIGR02118 family)